MKKISKSDYYHYLICIEALKSEKATKEEKDKCTSVLINALKAYTTKR